MRTLTARRDAASPAPRLFPRALGWPLPAGVKRVLCLLALGIPVRAEYAVRSELLTDPWRGAVHLMKVADFWKKYRDTVDGGFHNVVKPDGSAPSAAAKSFSPQSRLGWVFARAFMLSGDTAYLDLSDHALSFLYAKAWSPGTGGWYYQCSASGAKPRDNDYLSGKWSYMQHYALLGIGAALEARGGQRFPKDSARPDHWSNWRKGLDWNDRYLWDTTASRLGYFTYAGAVPHAGTGKGFTPTVDAITTHADLASLLSGDPADLERFTLLGDAMSDRMVAAMDSNGVKFGFPEEFGSDWSLSLNSSIMIGHMVKTSWCLGRVWLQNPKPKYLAAMAKVLEEMLASGAVDTVQGGTSSSWSWSSAPPVTHGLKNYWMTEQAINAGLMNWYLQADPALRERALRMADLSADFFLGHFVHPDGGTVMTTTWDGVAVDSALGDEWDAGYHSAEVGWLAYLYGQLFLHDRPIVLHYRLSPSAEEQALRLDPIRLKGDDLAIVSVRKDGAEYGDFSSAARTVHLPAGVGGVFRVEFARAGSFGTGVRSAAAGPVCHWDRHAGRLRFALPQAGRVRLRLVSPEGQLLETWCDRRLEAGPQEIASPRGNRPSGLYLLSLEGEGFRSSMLLLL